MKMRLIFTAAAGMLCVSRAVFAFTLTLPESLAREALSETVPTAISPPLTADDPAGEFTIDDYRLQWVGEAPAGVRVHLEPESLQWVRVLDVLAVPRARLWIEADPGHGGVVSQSGLSQVVDTAGKLPVALLSGPENAIVWNGKYRLEALYRPRSARRVYFDSGCSRLGVRAPDDYRLKQSWLYVGCRLIKTAKSGGYTTTLEFSLLWEGAAPEGLAAQRVSQASLFVVRQAPEPGKIRLVTPGEAPLELSYRVAEAFHHGAVSLGLGPYAWTFESPYDSAHSVTVMPTVYASYFLTETSRFVAFDATTFNAQHVMDIGAYLNTESTKFLDRRVGINVMLGAHLVGFSSNGAYHVKLGIPQGFEMIVTDFLKKTYNLTAGAFVYPEISGKAYNNAWIRYASPRIFYEFNYISWRETNDSDVYYSRSVGFTVGVPLNFLRFL